MNLTTSIQVTRVDDQDYGARATITPADDAGIDLRLTGFFEINADMAAQFRQGTRFTLTLKQEN